MDKNNMTVENYTENFCEAIQTLISKSIEGLKFDKTITCTIVDDSSADYGEYTVINSVGNKFQALGDKKAYKKDDSVFVLIPEGNYSNQKRIVSKADQDNELKKGYQESADTVIPVKKDLVKVKKENSSEDIVNFYLTANENGTKGTTKLIRTFIGPNNSNYIENNSYTRLAIETDITTNFGDLEEYITQGIYGILLKIEGKKEDGAIAQKEFIFNSEEFFGIPYRFAGTPVKQSAVFDISQLKTIQAIEVYIYENGDFYHAKEGYKEFLKNSNKITFSNINLTYGYDIDNYENGDLILTTVSPLIYDIPLGGSGDQKNLSLNFLRVNNLNNLEVVKDLSKTDPTFPFGENYNYLNKLYGAEAFNIYWYRWILSEENQENNNILNESMWQEQTSEQLFSFNFTPESSRPIEKIKTAIVFSKQFKEKTIEKDEDGNYVKEKLKDENGVEIEKYAYSENDYDPLIEINTENIKKDFILKYNSIKVNDDNEKIYRFKVYAYKGDSAEEILGTVGNRDNFESISAALQGSDLSDHIQIKDEDDILVAELNFVDIPEDKKAVYISNEIVFTNNQSKESLELNIIQNEELTLINDDYNGNYFIYDNISHRCAPGAAADKKLKVSFKEYVSEYIKDEDISLIWKIPKNNTMLINKSFRRKDSTGEILNEEFSESDGEDSDIKLKEWDNKTDNNFYILEDTPLAILPEGQTTQVINGVQEYEQFIQFSLKDYFSANASNNFIICEIKRGNKIISIKKDFSFGVMGSNGTNYAFSISLDKSKVFSPVGGMLRKSCFENNHEIIPHLYNLETKEEILIEDLNSFDIKCNSTLSDISISDDSDNKKFLNLPKWDDGKKIPDNYYLCLEATIKYQGYTLSTILPVPLISPDLNNKPSDWSTIKEYLGPEVLMYDSSGRNPLCNKNEAQLIGENLPSSVGISNLMVWEVQYQIGDDGFTSNINNNNNNFKDYFPYFQSEKDQKIIPYRLTYSNFYYSNFIKNTKFRIVAKRRLNTPQSGIKDTIIYVQPFIITQNAYGSSFLNNWDGNYYEDTGDGIILGRVLGAGIKSNENKFTGVLMGEVKKVTEDSSQIGLYGYSEGFQSFGFKQDGTAFLGKAGTGRIEFNGNKGIIKSWGDKDNPSQMIIDLDGEENGPPYLKIGHNKWKDKNNIIKKGYTVTLNGDGQFQIKAPTEDSTQDFKIDLGLTKDEEGFVTGLNPTLKVFNNIEFSNNIKYISSGGEVGTANILLKLFEKGKEELKDIYLKMGLIDNNKYKVEIFGDGSFNFGDGRLKYDGDNDLTMQNVTINWETTNQPRKMNLSFLEKDLINSTRQGAAGGVIGRCRIQIINTSNQNNILEWINYEGDYVFDRSQKSVFRYDGQGLAKIENLNFNIDDFKDLLMLPPPGDPGSSSRRQIFTTPKSKWGANKIEDFLEKGSYELRSNDLWIQPQKGRILIYNSGKWEETKDFYMNSFLGRSMAEDAELLGKEIQRNLGWGTVKIGEQYILSPYIGGGYLNISDSDTNPFNQVIIDPGFISQQGEVKQWVFCVKSNGKNVVTIDASGNATFEGKIYTASGNIGGWEIDRDKIYKAYFAENEKIQNYGIGMAASAGASYCTFWAGYKGDSNEDKTPYNDNLNWRTKTNFYVLNDGKVKASNIEITGGSINIKNSSNVSTFLVNNDGTFNFGNGKMKLENDSLTLSNVSISWDSVNKPNIDSIEGFDKYSSEIKGLGDTANTNKTTLGTVTNYIDNTLKPTLEDLGSKLAEVRDAASGAQGLAESANTVGSFLKEALGFEGTKLDDKYVISPYIGGGFLRIQNRSENPTQQVIIDPAGIGLTGKVFYIKTNGKEVFSVDPSGNASFAGTIQAKAGEIAGWTIQSGKLLAGGDDTGLKTCAVQAPSKDVTWVFAAGGNSHGSYGDCPFRVDKNGNLYSSSLTVRGGDIELGNASGQTYFSVSNTGQLKAYGAYFSSDTEDDIESSNSKKKVLRIKNGQILLKGRFINSSFQGYDEGLSGINMHGGYGYYSLARMFSGYYISKYNSSTDKYEDSLTNPTYWSIGIDGTREAETDRVKPISNSNHEVNRPVSSYRYITSFSMKVPTTNNSNEHITYAKFVYAARPYQGTHGKVVSFYLDAPSSYITTRNLGTSSYQWTHLYTQNSNIIAANVSTLSLDEPEMTSSDIRLKKDFIELNKWENFFMDLEPCAFKLKIDDNNKYHLGFKAQQVKDSLFNNKLRLEDFAGFVKVKYDKEECINDKKKELYEQEGIQDGDEVYSLRYTEFTALNTHMIQKNYKYIQSLEEKVKILEEKIEKLTSNI